MNSTIRLKAFLYLLVRDHLPTGVVEKLLDRVALLDDEARFICPLIAELAERWARQLGTTEKP